MKMKLAIVAFLMFLGITNINAQHRKAVYHKTSIVYYGNNYNRRHPSYYKPYRKSAVVVYYTPVRHRYYRHTPPHLVKKVYVRRYRY